MAGEWAADDLAGVLARVRRRGVDRAGAAAAAAAARACTSRASRPASATRPAGAGAQHRAPLRPVERPVRALPGRDHDLLLRAVFEPGDTLEPAPDAQVRDALPHWSTCGGPTICSRSAPAGAAWRCTPPRPAAAGSRPSTISRGPGGSWPRERVARGRPVATGSRCMLRDYREIEGRYSTRSSSIEMFEAVGEEYWPVVLRRLRPAAAAGRARWALQTITMPHGRYLASRARLHAGSTSTSSRAG